MESSQQMHVEVVFLMTVLAAYRAPERVTLVVAAHVQGVHHLVPERDVTVLARQLSRAGGAASGRRVDGLC